MKVARSLNITKQDGLTYYSSPIPIIEIVSWIMVIVVLIETVILLFVTEYAIYFLPIIIAIQFAFVYKRNKIIFVVNPESRMVKFSSKSDKSDWIYISPKAAIIIDFETYTEYSQTKSKRAKWRGKIESRSVLTRSKMQIYDEEGGTKLILTSKWSKGKDHHWLQQLTNLISKDLDLPTSGAKHFDADKIWGLEISDEMYWEERK